MLTLSARVRSRANGPLLPAVFAAAGIASFVTCARLAPGVRTAGTVATLTGQLADPVFWLVLGLSAPLLALLPVVLAALDPVYREVCGGARAAALRPLLLGLGLPVVAFLFAPWFFGSTAPALLWTGVGLGLLGTAWRLHALRDPADVQPDRAWWLVAAVVLVGAPLAASWAPAQGDEPHYLLVAHSLWEDADIDLADEYGDRAFEPYHPGPLSPHYKPGLIEGSRYSMHGIGYPLALLPAYAVGQLFSPSAVVVSARWFQLLAYGLFTFALYRLLETAASRPVALAGTAASVGLAPLVFAPLHLFPETLAIALACTALWLALEAPEPRGTLGAGALLALLPWLGVKYIPLAVTLALLAPWARESDCGLARRVAATLAPLSAALLLHGLFTFAVYGSWSPSAIYLGSDPNFARPPGYGGSWAAYVADWPSALRTLVGYFLDQREGLLAVGPHFQLAAAGIPWLLRRRRRLALLLLAVSAAHLLPYALSQQAGGQSPPARPIMAVVWVLALPLGVALTAGARQLVCLVRGALVPLSIGITLLLLRDPTLLPHDYGVESSWLLRSLSPQGAELWRWFPRWLGGGAPDAVAWAWAFGILVLCAVLLAASWKNPAGDDGPPRLAAWGAAAYSVVVLGLVGLWQAHIVLSDRHIGQDIAPGIRAWVQEAIPESAWAEPGGVWVRPGRVVDVVLTSPAVLPPQRGRLRTLVTARVRAQLEGDTWAAEIESGRPYQLDWRPGPGVEWRDQRAYRYRVRVDAGATAAAIEGGEDRRLLGVHLRLEPAAAEQGGQEQ